jgi:hypothetical protein
MKSSYWLFLVGMQTLQKNTFGALKSKVTLPSLRFSIVGLEQADASG